MNVKHSWILRGLALGVLITFSAGCRYFYSCSRSHCHNPEKRAEYLAERIKKKLDLDEKQTKLLAQFKKEYAAKLGLLYEKKKQSRAKLIEEVSKAKPDASMIRSAMAQKDKARIDMREFKIEKFIKLHAILKPEQRKKLAALIKKKMEKRRCHKD